MLAPMRGLVVFVGLALASAGCSADCAPSADIQVTVIPPSAIDPSAIATLRLLLSINGGLPRTLDFTPPHALSSPSSVVLRPDPPPAPKYNVTVTVEALDAAGELLAVGGATADVVANGCNRLQALLTALPGPGDGFIPMQDFSGDGGGPPDLTCAGPDEDSDGRPNSCDLCPADYDPIPTDSDGDGLPDACDPDPDTPANQQLYFTPFDVADGHWSGTFQVQNSLLDIQTQANDQPLVSTNGIDSLPANVRVQTFIFAPTLEGPTAQFSSDAGLFLGSSANFSGPTTSGMLCTINASTAGPGGSVDLNVVQNGQVRVPPVASQPLNFGTSVLYRMRLTQHGAFYSCEVVANGQPPTTSTATVGQAPAAPQFMALHAWHIEAHFHSVVAESVLP
jgi:hypothetical protein